MIKVKQLIGYFLGELGFDLWCKEKMYLGFVYVCMVFLDLKNLLGFYSLVGHV